MTTSNERPGTTKPPSSAEREALLARADKWLSEEADWRKGACIADAQPLIRDMAAALRSAHQAPQPPSVRVQTKDPDGSLRELHVAGVQWIDENALGVTVEAGVIVAPVKMPSISPEDYYGAHQAPQVEPIANVFREHYLAGIECDHAKGMDRPSCACSREDLGWHPSVGKAVDAWWRHVIRVSGRAVPQAVGAQAAEQPQAEPVVEVGSDGRLQWIRSGPGFPAGTKFYATPQPAEQPVSHSHTEAAYVGPTTNAGEQNHGHGPGVTCQLCGPRPSPPQAEHIASKDCWCEPEQDTQEPTVWIHRERH